MVSVGDDTRLAELRTQLAHAHAELESATGLWAKFIAFLSVVELCRRINDIECGPLADYLDRDAFY